MAFLFKREPILQESSANIEIANLQHFLETVASHISAGFGQIQIADLISLAKSMAIDEEAEKEFAIVYRGQKVKMKVGFFMDDLNEAEVVIFAPPNLAVQIDLDIDQINVDIEKNIGEMFC